MGKFKNVLVVFLAALCLTFISLVPSAYAQNQSTETKICFVEIVENEAFDSMMSGFKERMSELGYENISYDVKNAQGDMATLNSIAAQLKSSDYDVIVPIATPAAQAVVNAHLNQPSVFISITDPIGAGLMESMDKPTLNITGTSNKTPVDEIYELAEKLIPNLKEQKLGILYCTGEKNSQVTVDEMIEYLDSRNIDHSVKTIQNSSEAAQAAASLAENCGAIFVPMDSVVQSAMNQVTATALEYSTPVLGSDPIMVDSGALLSVACANKTIGAYSADLCSELLEGKDISDVAALDVRDNQQVISNTVVSKLGLDISSVDEAVFVGNTVQQQSDTSLENSSQFLSACMLGLEYGLLAVGVYITFRILDLADLTVDGSFCLGMAVSSVMAVAGHPVIGLIMGAIAGGISGGVTGELIVKARINPLLAGIITMTGLYSVNTYILGGPNVSLLGVICVQDVFASALGISTGLASVILIILLDALIVVLLALYFHTESGLSVRACGNNEDMCRASSINTSLVKVGGLALANGLVGLCGAVLAQFQGFADVSCGTGMVMVGLASVIIGEVFVDKSSVTKGLIFSVLGSVAYRAVIQSALSFNIIDANAMKLITAVIVGVFMAMPAIKKNASDAKLHKASKDELAKLDIDTNASALLSMRDVTKTFNPGTPMENTVLKGLDLDLNKGDFACVVGSNGAGKSTMFNTIAGSVISDMGKISVCGRDVTYTSDFRRARHLSRVFQDPMQGTAPDLTVAENIALAYGRSRNSTLSFAMREDVRKFIYNELASLGFGLEDRMDVKVGMLSGGQRQAVTLLMATIGEPDLLLLDEHTAALDPQATKRIMYLTEKITREKNITTLMITHDLEVALKCGNKTLVMDQGRIAAVVEGSDRVNMTVDDLLDLFKRETGKSLLTDEMLLV